MASSTSCFPTRTYDVFISFRGEDTRNNFTGYFYSALCREKVKAFIDEDRLKKGDKISPALSKAIEESKISVVIFSENYASSSWCLTELAHILRCKEVNNQLVIPVFYHVEPSDICQQQNSYAAAFSKHEKHFEDEKVQQWRNALKEASNICGWNVPVTRSESKVVEEIVRDILKKLDDMSSNDDFKDLVGIDKKVQDIKRMLQINSLDVRIIGIWGMGGIGKTALAEVILNGYARQFESCCFLRDIKSKPHKLDKLQKKLFSELLEEHVENVNKFVKNRLKRTKVLIVLDDVDDVDQLEYLIGDRDWFGHGSRIIITTRDKQVLNNIKADGIYEVDELNFNEALQLFYTKAFKGNSPSEVYAEMSKSVVTRYAKGVPLALKVLGCHLYSKSIEEWESELKKLENIPFAKVQKMLKLSYDGLSYEDKNIFLDIAFFFIGTEKGVAKRILDSYRVGVAMGIRVLIDRSLLTVDHSNRLSMHDLIQEMGIEIVRLQSPDEPGKRSRLRSIEDVCNVLKNNTGTKKIQGMSMDISKINVAIWLSPRVFKKMNNLKFLNFHGHWVGGKLHFSKSLEYLPGELRYLRWDNCFLRTLSPKFWPQNLVELHLNNSKLNILWDGVQHIESLKFLNLKDSENLTEIPDLSWALNLERIDLSRCISLKHLPSSIGKLESLQFLDLFGCSNFEKFPELPKNVTYLSVANTAIEKVPLSIERLSHLLVFNLRDCKRLKSLPCNFFKLKSLRELYLEGCLGLKYLPEVLEPMEHLIFFEAQELGITRLPSSIENLVGITNLELQCNSLFEIPDSLFSLPALLSLDLSETNISRVPESIKLSKLRILDIRNCKFLQSIPMLPLSIRRVDARGCTSLGMVSNSWNLLAQVPKWDPSFWQRFSFEGCLNFDHRNIVIEFQIRALSFASTLFLLRHKGWIKLDRKTIITETEVAVSLKKLIQVAHGLDRWMNAVCLEVLLSYTGDEIPEWFSYQNVGCSINIKLPPHWCGPKNFMGFAFCFVVETSHIDNIKARVNLNWEVYLKTDYNHVRKHRFAIMSEWFTSRYDYNLVLMTTYLDTSVFDFDYVTEMLSYFSFHDPLKRKVKRCGIRMLSLQDAIELGFISSQYIFADSNVVTNEMQPSGFWENVLYPLLGFQVFPSRRQLCEKLLSSKIQQRHKELWLWLVWDCLPVREVVNRQMDVADTTCPICGMVLESATHLFLHCKSVQPLWFMSRWGLRTDFLLCDSVASFLEVILFGDRNSNIYSFDREFLLYASILVHAIWLARNELVHRGKRFDIPNINSSVQAQFNHIIQPNQLGCCKSVSRATVRDSDIVEPNPKRAKLSISL